MTVYYTAGVRHTVETVGGFGKFVINSFERFLHNDWGDTCKEDAETNNIEPELAMGSYKYHSIKLWIKRDYDTITLLLPEEY